MVILTFNNKSDIIKNVNVIVSSMILKLKIIQAFFPDRMR